MDSDLGRSFTRFAGTSSTYRVAQAAISDGRQGQEPGSNQALNALLEWDGPAQSPCRFSCCSRCLTYQLRIVFK